mgnify:CR=1 FL=1
MTLLCWKMTGALMRRFSMNTPLYLCVIRLVSRRYPQRRKHWRSWKICRSTGDLYAEHGDNDSFDIGRHIKEKYEHIPIVILTPFSHGITKRIINEDLSAFEYVFCWLGNTDLLVSIIKLIEDKMNLEHDVQEVGVQLILLVEDGIRFYSSILPNLYKFVLKQSQEFSTEA